MGLIDYFLDSGLEPDTDRLVTGVLKRYGQMQAGGALADSLIGRLSGQHAMDEENERLDIALKRRALGLQDTEDYNDAVNDHTALYAAGLGGALQRIPEPGFLSPKIRGSGKTVLRTAISLGEKSHVGSPGIIGRIARAIR